MVMRSKLVLGASLLLAAASCLAGSAGAPFEVKVTLNSNSNGSCTSMTGSAIGSASVQVRCTANVFVNIAQAGSIMPAGFSPAQATRLSARDAQLPANTETQAMSSVSVSAGDANTQLSANTETQASNRTANLATLAQTVARRLEDNRGTRMALHVAVASAGDRFGPPVEMLVSF